MSCSLQVEMDDYLQKIEHATMNSLEKIEESLRASGKQFDKGVRKRFIRCAKDRLKSSFVQITIESMENGGKKGSLGLNISNRSADSTPIIKTTSDPVVVISSSEEGIEPTPKRHHLVNELIVNEHTTKSVNEHKSKEEGRKNQPNGSVDQSRRHKSQRSMSSTRAPLSDGELESSSSEGDGSDLSITKSDLVDERKTTQTIQTTNERPTADSQPDDKQNPIKLLQHGFRAGLKRNMGEIISTKYPADLAFHCFYCSSKQIDGSPHRHVEDVYAHWLISHRNSANSKPFQFYVVENMACYFCDVIDSYGNILAHQKECHPNESTVIVAETDRKKCALCAYNESPLIGHFEIEHEILLQFKDFNPLCLTDDTLNGLLEIDIRTRYCKLCTKFFDTKSQFVQHYSLEHPRVEAPHRVSPSYTIECVICPCHTKITASEYFNHIQSHFREFACSKCDFFTDNLVDLVDHDKSSHRTNSMKYRCLELSDRFMQYFFSTKVAFSNGLVLIMHNLLHTRFDMSNRFGDIIGKLLGTDD